MQQCITWDGTTLACLKLHHPGDSKTILYNVNQPSPRLSFPRSRLGVIQALILHTETPAVMSVVKDLLETLPLDEFIQFYYRVVRHGLLSKDFEFMLVAVMDSTALAMHVRGRRQNMFHYVAREEQLAVGDHATAAMLLMDTGLPAQTACGASQLDTFMEHDLYDACQSMTYRRDEDSQLLLWEYACGEELREAFYALPQRRAPLMQGFYAKLANGEPVL